MRMMRRFRSKSVKKVVYYRCLIRDDNNIYNATVEGGFKYLATFLDRSRACYFLEGHLNSLYPDWFFNTSKDEYQCLKTKKCIGRVKKIYE